MAYEFLSLQGKANLARNIDGKSPVLVELGNLTDLTIGVSVEKIDIAESKTGSRQKVASIEKGKDISVEMTLNEQTRHDVALAFQAEMVELGGKSVAEHELKTGTLKVGDKVKLSGANLSDLVIKDSTDKVLELDTHYSADLKYGVFSVLSLDGVQQPLKASFTEGKTQSGVFFSLPANAEFYFVFEGINSIDNKKMLVELWRFKPSADGSMGFINEELGELQIKGSCYADTTRQKDAKLGGFGRIVYLD